MLTAFVLAMAASAAGAAAADMPVFGTGAEVKTVPLDEPSGVYDITVNCKNSAVTENGTSYIALKTEGFTDAEAVIPMLSDYGEVKLSGVTLADGSELVFNKAADTELEVQSVTVTESAERTPFLKGVDITELSYIESLGGKYYDADGNESDAVKLLADNGANLARIRLYNNPGKGRGDGTYYLPDGFQNLDDTLALARRAKENGMQIQYTFHYSDYWSNGDRQIIPSDWAEQIDEEIGYDVSDPAFLRSMTSAQRTQIIAKLEELMYSYTYDVMTKLKEQDTVPEYVTIGNETNGGLLFPFGNTFAANMNSNDFELVYDDNIDNTNDIKCPEDWASMVRFNNAAYDAVKAVSPETQVGFHLSNGSIESIYTWWIDKAEKNGIKYDYIGASYYPSWTNNTVATAVSFCNTISKKYDKDILIMETGYNWNPTLKNGQSGQLSDIDAYKDIYPSTLAGHKGFMAELFNGLKNVDGGRCIGDIYWDPVMIHVDDGKGGCLSGWAYRESDDGVDANVVENTTLFDFDGKAIPSLDIFNYNREQQPATSEGSLTLISSSIADGKVSAEVENNASETLKATIFAAVYDSDGILKEVRVNAADIQPKEKTSFSIEYSAAEGDSVKAFCWDEELRPYFEIKQ